MKASVLALFRGRKVVIATKHEKEKVIAPLLEELGMECIVDPTLDTDTLGTFSGEVNRKSDPITTARNKCELAMALTGCDLAIASEGSFGPHPAVFFAYADEEYLVFIDKKNGLEIVEKEVSLNTNFNGAYFSNLEELRDFARKANFPSHGLIMRKNQDSPVDVVKGIVSWEALEETFNRFYEEVGKAFVETDMRAMYNPMRMKVIELATQKLIKKINSLCPNCETPGFGVTEVKTGLPCKQCLYPTKSTLSWVYQCKKCTHVVEHKYPHKKISEEPTYCDFCNP